LGVALVVAPVVGQAGLTVELLPSIVLLLMGVTVVSTEVVLLVVELEQEALVVQVHLPYV
jgi:hypothetical protein